MMKQRCQGINKAVIIDKWKNYKVLRLVDVVNPELLISASVAALLIDQSDQLDPKASK